jgi:hypothetical protein
LTTHGKILETQVAQLTTHPSQQLGTFQIQPEFRQKEYVDVIFSSSEEKVQKPEEQEKCTETQHRSQTQAEEEHMEGKNNIDALMPKQIKKNVPRYLPPHRFITFPQRLVKPNLVKQTGKNESLEKERDLTEIVSKEKKGWKR